MQAPISRMQLRRCQPLVRNVSAKANKHIALRPHVVATSSRARTSSALSLSADTSVSTDYTRKPKKRSSAPKKQMITVAVDSSDNSAQGLKWLLDSFSGSGAMPSAARVHWPLGSVVCLQTLYVLHSFVRLFICLMQRVSECASRAIL